MDCLGGRSQTKWCYGVPGNLDIKTALDLLFVGSDRDWQSCSGYVFSSVFAVVGWWGRPKTWSRKMRSLMSPITTRSQVKTKPSMRSITLSPGIRWVYSIRLEHLRQYFFNTILVFGFQTEGVRVSVDVLSQGFESPILFVVRQKQAVLSFQVPLILRGLWVSRLHHLDEAQRCLWQ